MYSIKVEQREFSVQYPAAYFVIFNVRYRLYGKYKQILIEIKFISGKLMQKLRE